MAGQKSSPLWQYFTEPGKAKCSMWSELVSMGAKTPQTSGITWSVTTSVLIKRHRRRKNMQLELTQPRESGACAQKQWCKPDQRHETGRDTGPQLQCTHIVAFGKRGHRQSQSSGGTLSASWRHVELHSAHVAEDTGAVVCLERVCRKTWEVYMPNHGTIGHHLKFDRDTGPYRRSDSWHEQVRGLCLLHHPKHCSAEDAASCRGVPLLGGSEHTGRQCWRA